MARRTPPETPAQRFRKLARDGGCTIRDTYGIPTIVALKRAIGDDEVGLIIKNKGYLNRYLVVSKGASFYVVGKE